MVHLKAQVTEQMEHPGLEFHIEGHGGLVGGRQQPRHRASGESGDCTVGTCVLPGMVESLGCPCR